MNSTFFINQIRQIKQDLTNTNSNWLYHLEAIYSLTQLENLLTNISFEESYADIQNFLINRWERIRSTDLAYIHAINDPVTTLCLTLAKQIAPIIGKSALALLMPTLKTSVNALTLWTLDDYELQHILLSDDDTNFFDIFASLEFVEQIALTPAEQTRLVNHSQETLALTEVNSEILALRKNNSIGSVIEACLINRLQQAGMDGGRDGNDGSAGFDSDLGLITFQNFLNTLSRPDKRKLFSCRINADDPIYFGHLWERLTHPKQTIKKIDEHTQEKSLSSIYCVETVAIDLRELLRNNLHLYDTRGCNHHQFMATLYNNAKTASNHLLKKISMPNFKIESSYGSAGYNRLADKVLTTSLLHSLAAEDLLQVRQQLIALDKIKFINQLEKLPVTNRFNVICLAGIEFILEKICLNGYQLAYLFELLEFQAEKCLALLTDQQLRHCIQDKFQFATVLLNLSTLDANKFILRLGIEFILNKFPTSHHLKMLLLKKIPLAQWDKLTGLIQLDCLKKHIKHLLTCDFAQLPARSHWKFIELVGIARAAVLIEDPAQLKTILTFLTSDQQQRLLVEINIKNLFLKKQIEKRPGLKFKIATVLHDIDDFVLFPEAHKKIATETLSFYCEERSKESSWVRFFSMKIKAAKALHEVAINKAEKSTLIVHKKQLERDNDLGKLYQQLKI